MSVTPISVNARLVAAARELLRLKDLKTEAESINTTGSWSEFKRQKTMLREYESCKHNAWNMLRIALAAKDNENVSTS